MGDRSPPTRHATDLFECRHPHERARTLPRGGSGTVQRRAGHAVLECSLVVAGCKVQQAVAVDQIRRGLHNRHVWVIECVDQVEQSRHGNIAGVEPQGKGSATGTKSRVDQASRLALLRPDPVRSRIPENLVGGAMAPGLGFDLGTGDGVEHSYRGGSIYRCEGEGAVEGVGICACCNDEHLDAVAR